MSEQIIIAKKQEWSKMAVTVYNTEVQLNLVAQNAIKDITHPITFKEIEFSENKLKELKKIKKDIEVERKKITSNFDELHSRLMEPEKLLEQPINNLTAAIIKVKTEYELHLKKQADISNEKKKIEEFVKSYINQHIAEKKTKIFYYIKSEVELLSTLKINDINEYITKRKQELDIFNYITINKPTYKSLLLTNDEVNGIINEQYADQHEIINMLPSYLYLEFEKAIINKNDASVVNNLEKIEQERIKNDLIIQLDTNAINIDSISNSNIKELKKHFEVDMPENLASATFIMAAFFNNINVCKSKLSVEKWFSFSVKQAAGALSKVKTDDNYFTPQNVVFKEVSKL